MSEALDRRMSRKPNARTFRNSLLVIGMASLAACSSTNYDNPNQSPIPNRSAAPAPGSARQAAEMFAKRLNCTLTGESDTHSHPDQYKKVKNLDAVTLVASISIRRAALPYIKKDGSPKSPLVSEPSTPVLQGSIDYPTGAATGKETVPLRYPAGGSSAIYRPATHNADGILAGQIYLQPEANGTIVDISARTSVGVTGSPGQNPGHVELMNGIIPCGNVIFKLGQVMHHDATSAQPPFIVKPSH